MVTKFHPSPSQHISLSLCAEDSILTDEATGEVERLAWAGHLGHMDKDRTIKKIFNTKPDGVRRVGRPKLRWEDGVDQDTGFSWFPSVYKQMLRWFPRFQVATTCFSCSPPDLTF
jgi:hypothetical protein